MPKRSITQKYHWTGPTLVIISLCFIAAFFVVAAMRITYPYELQWMEGSILENVRRAVEGKQLYVQPSMEFVPYLYMPLYYYISAAVSWITGVSFFTIRLVSLLAAIGCVAVVFMFVIRETGNRIAAVSAVGLFAAGYNLCSGYYDVGRIDTLFLFFMLAGMYMLRPDSRNILKSAKNRNNNTSCGNSDIINVPFIRILISAVYFLLAFFTKQTALIVVIIICLYLFVARIRYRYLFAAAFFAFAAGGCLLLEYYTGGWFSYYVFGLPLEHALDLRGILVFIGLTSLYFTCFIVLPSLIRNRLSGFKALYYLSLAAAMSVLTVAALSNALFDLNLFMPMAAIMAVLFGLSVDYITRTNGNAPHKGTLYNGKKMGIMCALLILQFVVMLYNPLKYIPDADDIKAGNYLAGKISNMEGNLFIPAHPYLAAGREGEKYTHIMPLYDLLELRRNKGGNSSKGIIGGSGSESISSNRGMKDSAAANLMQQFTDALKGQYFDYIILDNVNRLGFMQELIDEYYIVQEKVFSDESVFWTFSGAKRRPEYIYVRKNILK